MSCQDGISFFTINGNLQSKLLLTRSDTCRSVILLLMLDKYNVKLSSGCELVPGGLLVLVDDSGTNDSSDARVPTCELELVLIKLFTVPFSCSILIFRQLISSSHFFSCAARAESRRLTVLRKRAFSSKSLHQSHKQNTFELLHACISLKAVAYNNPVYVVV